MSRPERVRNNVAAELRLIAAEIPAIRSLSIVGSFVTAQSLAAVADIDVVIIVEELRSAVFETIVDRFSRIDAAALSLPDYTVRVNPTFGPLKFDDEQTVVFHVMVYDRAGHRDHVIKSPFTCLDWERHPALHGPSLREVYSAVGVQPTDIIASRRGIDSYLADLAAGAISYREYDFTGGTARQVSRALTLDPRHAVEFAYHILRNLFLNTLKVLTGWNQAAEGEELLSRIAERVPIPPDDADLFRRLYAWKRHNGALPDAAVEKTVTVVRTFHAALERMIADAPLVVFARHGRTADNDGAFLGVRRDPSLAPEDQWPDAERAYLQALREVAGAVDDLYTSPLRRAHETADRVAGSHRRFVDGRLQEIDYGLAEGLHFPDLQVKFPEIPLGWERHEDPPFPEGERQSDVAERLNRFLEEELIPAGRSACIITHNVVLRTLLGRRFDAPVHAWYRLQPRHLEPLTFRIVGDTLVPELSSEQRTRFRDQLFPCVAALDGA